MKTLRSFELGSEVVSLKKVSGNRYPCGTPYAYYGVRITGSYGKEYPCGDEEFYDNIRAAYDVYKRMKAIPLVKQHKGGVYGN